MTRFFTKLEGVARAFTAKISGIEELDYWDRLVKLRMYSQERRRERYQLIFIWKLSQGLVGGYSLPFQYSERRSATVLVHGYWMSCFCQKSQGSFT